jgi:Ca-activated chloride channel homolog
MIAHAYKKPAPWVLAVCIVGCVVSVSLHMQGQAQNQPAPGPQPKFQPSTLPPDIEATDPAVPLWMHRAPAPAAAARPAETPASVPKYPQSGRVGEVTRSGSGFTLRVQSEEVSLPATVVDNRQRLVTSLEKRNFVVFENGMPQTITLFRREDVPVSIGILVDNSGSMRQKRAAVAKAVLNLVKSSNPQDEVFVVNFNDRPYLDQDFTSDVSLLQHALDRLDSRGSTALYDSVVAAANHMSKRAQRQKRILLVITDGEDNESQTSLDEAVRTVEKDKDKSPTIYSIGILGNPEKERGVRRALETLSFQTGGAAFFPRDLETVNEVSQEIAHEIRNQYTITYKPTNPQTNGGYRRIKVVARSSDRGELQVRTKNGYFAGSSQ